MRARMAGALLASPVASIPGVASSGKGIRKLAELPKQPRPLLIVMNEVVEGLLPKILAGLSRTTRRVTVGDGLFGLGQFEPRGGSDGGVQAPPRNLFPRAGFGNSLNVDPVSGRNSLGNTQ